MDNEQEYDGIIKEWDFTPTNCIFGYIYEDKKGRWPDGYWIRTSSIKKIEGDLVYTLNSVYKLENKDGGSMLAKLSDFLTGGTTGYE